VIYDAILKTKKYIFVIFESSKLGENDIKRTKHDSRQHG